MSIFRTRGFDSIIGKGVTVHGSIEMEPNTTLVIEGMAFCSEIKVRQTDKVDVKTTLRVVGELQKNGMEAFNVNIHNVIVTGVLVCDELRVEGTLAIKTGAQLKARKILYRELIVETGALMQGEMRHLDHVSEGEYT